MINCRDVYNLNLDGVELLAGEEGLDRTVSWTYMCQTRPYRDHMNQGNFALIVVDYVRFDIEQAYEAMIELDEIGISAFAISIMDDREAVPRKFIDKANELKLPFFYVRWESASFVDIDQTVGRLIVESEYQNKRTGDYLFNLLFGYDINVKYIEKISGQFGSDFRKPHRVGIIVVDRKYSANLEQDEHIYEYYANTLNHEVLSMESKPMFLRFLNKFVLLFEATPEKTAEHELERTLVRIDSDPAFAGKIRSTCLLGGAYVKPGDYSKSYQEAKRLIQKKNILPNPKHKKVLSASTMGIYKYMFNSGNQDEIMNYCEDKLKTLEEYDHSNGTFLQETLVTYYMNGFNANSTADALFIHRNTLQYRLHKIEHLLEMELDDYMEYLDLVNCILVKKLMFS